MFNSKSNTKTIRLTDSVSNEHKQATSLPIGGRFEKVSFDTFYMSIVGEQPNDQNDERKEKIKNVYDSIVLPHRQSKDSPMYNIYFPFGETPIIPNQSIIINTGIKVKLNSGWCLQCTINPLLAINNDLFTHEIITYITPDKYNMPNEGMISFEIINTSKYGRMCLLQKDTKLCSCLFIPYGLSANDMVES